MSLNHAVPVAPRAGGQDHGRASTDVGSDHEQGGLLVTGTDALLNGIYVAFDLFRFVSGKATSGIDWRTNISRLEESLRACHAQGDGCAGSQMLNFQTETQRDQDVPRCRHLPAVGVGSRRRRCHQAGPTQVLKMVGHRLCLEPPWCWPSERRGLEEHSNFMKDSTGLTEGGCGPYSQVCLPGHVCPNHR